MKRLSGFIYRRNGFMKSSKFLSPFLSIKNYLERNHSSLYYSHHVATSRRHVLIPEIIDELRRQPTKIAKDVDDRQLSMLKDAFQINEIIRFHFHMNSLNCMNLMKKFTRDTPLNLTQREYNDLTQQASRTSITMVNMEFLQKMKEEILINIYGERDEKKRKQLDRFNSSLNPYKSEEIDEIMNSDNQHDPSSTSFEEKLDENDRKMNFQKFHHQLISLDEPDDFQKALTMEIDKISEQTTRDKLNLSQLNESDDNYQILLEKIVRNNWSYPKDGRIYSLKDRLISSVLN
ncbi:hypothetical protein SNEBB_003576 [Seison nebaliae]|nr:hypothetical protein SNEBB_003576 [Seison nebaliae]